MSTSPNSRLFGKSWTNSVSCVLVGRVTAMESRTLKLTFKWIKLWRSSWVSMTHLLKSGVEFYFLITCRLSIGYLPWLYKRKGNVLLEVNSTTPFPTLKGAQSQIRLPNSSQPKFQKDRPFWTSCNAPGHTIDPCYKIHRYPPGYKKRPKNSNKSSAPVNQVSG